MRRTDEASSRRTAESREGLAERGALARAMNVAVGREDLFDERRAGARHADDEDGRRIAVRRRAAPSLSRAALNASIEASTKARCASRENGCEPREQPMPCDPLGEGAARRALRRPEFGEIEPRHDRVLGNGVRAHVGERGLHRQRLVRCARARRLRRAPARRSASARAARARPASAPIRTSSSRTCARFRRAAELQQRQRLVEDASDAKPRVARRFGAAEQRQSLGRALLLQQIGRQIEPRADGVRLARDRLAQEPLGRFRFAGDPHEGAEVGESGGVIGIGGERLPHRRLGVLDRALAIAREAVIDPGVGPARIQVNCRGEGLFGARGVADRGPRLAIGVMRRRELGGAPARFARRGERGLIVADRQQRDGGYGETGRDRRQATLAPF